MAYEETRLEKKRRLQDAPRPLTPEDAAWLDAYDESIRLQNQLEEERVSNLDAAAMAAGIGKLSPQWIDDAAPALLELYKDSIRLEVAYDFFVENYEQNGYKDRIEESTQRLTMGGIIASLSSAEAALGPVEVDSAGTHTKGTNWLNVKTKWRQFGLITGYNMQFLHQTLSVLDIRAEEQEQKEAWWKFWEASAQERTQQLVSVKSPRYITRVGGSSEPGLSLTSLEAENNPGASALAVGESDWFYPRVDTKNAAPPGGADTLNPSNVLRRQYHEGDAAWDSLASGEANNDDGRHALDPLYYGTTIQIDNYFGQASTAQSPMYGHLLSPEIMDLITLVGVNNKTMDRQPFLDARGELMTSGIAIWNGAKDKLVSGGYYTWILTAASTPPTADETPSAWSRAFDAYGNRAHASYNGPSGPSPQKSKSSKVVHTDLSVHIFPDRLALLHTLPLEGIPFFKPATDGWMPVDTFPGDINLDSAAQGFPIRQPQQPAYDSYKAHIVEIVPPLVKDEWKTLYEGFENGTNAFAALDAAIREHIGTDVNELFGYSDKPLQDKPTLHDEVERILDFFGAGAIKSDTEAQKRERAITGGTGAAPTLAEIDPAALDVVGNYRALKPFDLQCYLMENIDAVTEIHKRKIQQSPYKNIIPLVSGEGGPGTAVSQINHVGDKEAKALLNIPTAVYAALTPYIKIYRVDYDPETGMTPLGQQELPIPNYTKKEDLKLITGGRLKGWGLQSFTWKLDGVQPAEVDNNISANLTFYFQTINDLFEGSERSGGGGNQAGLEHATPLDLLISAATIKSSLPADNEDQDEDPDDKPKTCKGLQNATLAASTQYEGAQYRIKVVAGWSTPPLHVLRAAWPVSPGVQDENREAKLKALVRGLDASRVALYLQQVRHNINFNENGSVKLSIDYQAALTGILTGNKMDILGPTDKQTVAELKALKTKTKKSKEKINEIEQDVISVQSNAEVQSSQIKTQTKPHREEMKKLLERKKELLNEDRLRKYRKFLSALYGRAGEGAAGTTTTGETKIYTMRVAAGELLQTPLGQIKDPEERALRARDKMRSSESELVGAEITTGSDFNTNLVDALTEEEDTRASDTSDADSKNTVSQNITNQWNKKVGTNSQNIDVINIPYFYLGDLIDMIIESNDVLGANGEPSKALKANFLMFLSDIYVTNPLLLYQFQNSDEIACSDNIDENEVLEQLRAKGLIFNSGVKKHINIGDIPISVDEFNVWFKNHVVKNQRNSYYLMHFLKDICASLIGESLKKGCFEENVVDDIRFDTSIAHFNNVDRDTGMPRVAPIKPGKTAPSTMNFVSTETLAALVRESTPENDIPPLYLAATHFAGLRSDNSVRVAGAEKFFNRFNITSGLILYSTDSSPRNRHGDVDEDRRVGIYHNYIGSPVGLVKKVSFQRQEQPYLREAKIQKFGNLGAQQLRELYSVRLDLVGNTLFKNGQYTFVRPTMAGTDPKLVRMLGLEGYFLITGVNHTITPAGYNVSVTALQEGINFEGGQLPIEGMALPVDPSLEAAPTDRALQHAEEEAATNAMLDEAVAGFLAEDLEKSRQDAADLFIASQGRSGTPG
tara:strand:+ start:686 stop:5425 length:4740 start_codon:yes stop_codon:yes gene_type:complete